MKFIIRTIEHTATGREIVRDREVEAERIEIGRRASNAVHLPDLAVEQVHAIVEPIAGGQLRVAATSDLGFTLDGRTTTEAVFDPHEGAELGFGSYRLDFTREHDGPVVITQTRAEKDESTRDAKGAFALAGKLPSKRAMAYTLAALALVFLIVPIVSFLTSDEETPVDPKTLATQDSVLLDASWSTGALSLAHHGLEKNCKACHVKPFEPVRDETCRSCHEGIGDHASADRLIASRGSSSAFDAMLWKVAETFGKEGPAACTTCHTEHEGMVRMPPPSQAFCADCHASMDERLSDTALENAADFGTAHPQFKPLVFTALGATEPQRISLDLKPREANGLRFPHKLHLDDKGGVARMAMTLSNYSAPLECKDCHVATADGSGFKPVEMEEACESCHSLVYDKVGSTFRKLSHGDVDQMLADLAAMDRSPRAPIVTGRKRPGEYAPGGRYYQRFGAPARSLVAINRALSREGVCGECHLPATQNGKPSVVPVNLPDRFFAHARFDHKAHRQEECSSCHAAAESNDSADLLLPPIAVCRDCHLGENAAQAEVPSSCAMCHSYHPSDHPMPADHLGKAGKAVAWSARPWP